MAKIVFGCGCWITRVMGSNKIHDAGLCNKHLLKALDLRGRRRLANLADLILRLNGVKRYG